MPCRYHIWAVVVLFISCASLLDRKNDFERGLISYQNGQFQEAAGHFSAYHSQHPHSDSTLYYLFNCYGKLDQPDNQILVLDKLTGRGVEDLNVYLNLVHLCRKYAKYDRLYTTLLRIPRVLIEDVDKRLILTRRFLAELIAGASKQTLKTDPMIFCISKNYLPLFPDGKTYEEDTLSTANLIVLLDRLVDPFYPRDFYTMKEVRTKSYLYLPYMRLVEIGALTFDPYLEPDQTASVLATSRAIDILVTRGYLD